MPSSRALKSRRIVNVIRDSPQCLESFGLRRCKEFRHLIQQSMDARQQSRISTPTVLQTEPAIRAVTIL